MKIEIDLKQKEQSGEVSSKEEKNKLEGEKGDLSKGLTFLRQRLIHPEAELRKSSLTKEQRDTLLAETLSLDTEIKKTEARIKEINKRIKELDSGGFLKGAKNVGKRGVESVGRGLRGVKSLGRKGVDAAKRSLDMMGEGHARSMNPERGQPYTDIDTSKGKIDTERTKLGKTIAARLSAEREEDRLKAEAKVREALEEEAIQEDARRFRESDHEEAIQDDKDWEEAQANATEGKADKNVDATKKERVGGVLRRGVDVAKKSLDMMGEGHARSMNPERGQPHVGIDTEKSFDPEQEVVNFIAEFKLESILTPEFLALSEGQKLLVVQSLKQRIADIVKSDAQTQYSEDVKKSGGFGKVKAFLTKETATKNFEAKAFRELNESEEGKKLIQQNLIQLTAMAEKRDVKINKETKKPEIIFLNPDDYTDSQDKISVQAFNTAANKFREMPYEWGQEKVHAKIKIGKSIHALAGDHKIQYEKAKSEYEKAKRVILEIETKNKGEAAAMTNILQLNNMIQMDQLVNTHPEFEAELIRLSKDANLLTNGQDVLNLIGKNKTYKAIFAGGFAARWLARGAALASGMTAMTGVAAAVVGGAIGGVRNYVKGKETLEERKKGARYGKKDESKERVQTTDATRLINRLEKLVAEMEDPAFSSKSPEERAKEISLLRVRIEHTQGKIEKGQVNFGDAQTSLNTQLNLVDVLNRALVLKEVMSTQHPATGGDGRIDNLLSIFGEQIKGKTEEAQRTFIRKQVRNGVLIGAGFATVGYVVRYVGEHIGWWGGHGAENIKTETPQHATTEITHDSTDAEKIHARYLWTKSHPNTPPTIKTDSVGKMIDSTQTDTTHTINSPKILSDSTKISPDSGKIVGDTTRVVGADTTTAGAVGAGGKGVEAVAKATQEATTTVEKIHSGFSLDQPTEFEVKGPAQLEHAYEKLLLSHHLPHEDVSSKTVVLDKIMAARTLNEAANLVRLTEGHGAAGITAADFAKFAEFKNGVLHIIDPKGFNEVMDKLHIHSQDLAEKGIFNDPDSATGYIKRVDWVDKVEGNGMHGTVEHPGITGHPEVDAKQIEDFSQIPDPHEHAVTSATRKVSSIYEDLQKRIPEEIKLSVTDKLENPKSMNWIDRVDTTPANPTPMGEPLDPLRDVYNDYSRIWTRSDVDYVFNDNIRHLYPPPSGFDLFYGNSWILVKNSLATEVLNTPAENSDEVLGPVISYLHRLQEVTGLKPNGANWFRSGETVAKYIMRATQKAAEMGTEAMQKIRVR